MFHRLDTRQSGNAPDQPNLATPVRGPFGARKVPAWAAATAPTFQFGIEQAIQAKLIVNQPGDRYEQEADRVAEKVVCMPDGQQQADAEEHPLQRQAVPQTSFGGSVAPPSVHVALTAPGRPLDAATRAYMEPRFRTDFGQVRVHTDTQAAESAREVKARAYTVGRDVVFGSGHYAPQSPAGQHLLAHELAHVEQQRGAGDTVAPRQSATVLQKQPEQQPQQAAPAQLAPWQPAGVAVPSLSGCKNEKQLQNVVKANPAFKAWELETIQKGDNYTKIAQRAQARRADLFEGRLAVYATEVKKMYGNALLQIGHCLLLPVGWKDPNIGTLPAAPTKFTASDAATQAIAVVFAEQTGTGVQAKEQQRYIWYSIRKRIESANFPPNLANVLDPGQYHAIGKGDYKAAIDDLVKNDPPKLAGVRTAKDTVMANWANALPFDSGVAYFHWRKDSTPDKCFAGADPATSEGESKEKECAWNWAKRIKVSGSVPKKDGWLKRIRSDGGGPIGSMYIYPGD